MSASVLYMSMSLDGYIAGPDDGPGNPGGDGFMRLHEWLATADGDSAARPDQPERCTTRWRRPVRCWWAARTPEQAGHYQGNHHGVPIVVVSHRPPPPSVASYPSVTYVTDGIESAMTQAKTAAGDRAVMVHGAYTAQRALQAGVLDELQIHQLPVLFGQGLRLFDALPSHVELEIARVIDTPEATHIRYRVRR